VLSSANSKGLAGEATSNKELVAARELNSNTNSNAAAAVGGRVRGKHAYALCNVHKSKYSVSKRAVLYVVVLAQ
jgi:hypothetical protein